MKDISKRTDELISRVDNAINEMLNRYQTLIELTISQVPANTAYSAAYALQTQNNATQLIRASEDLRQIIREVKEIWVLNTPRQELQESQLSTDQLNSIQKQALASLQYIASSSIL